MLLPCFWQMLLPYFDVVDVTTTRLMLCLFFVILADVIANLVYTCGRYCCHHDCVADVIAIQYVLL